MLEPLHAVVYFAPESRARAEAAGMRGFWMGYFGSRCYPLGPVGPEVVGAVCFGFDPAMVARAIPDAWHFATMQNIATARYAGVDAALRRLLGDALDTPAVAEAAELAREATTALDCGGRPLAAAYAALPWPEPPHLQLWHAATVLREHRGDGHVVANVADGIDGLAAHVLQVGTGSVPREWLQSSRGWSDEAWATAEQVLLARGWLEPDRTLSGAGRAVRAAVEARTDALAAAPWDALGAERSERLRALVLPLATAIVDAGEIPVPNPIGVPRPA